jgi:hypothetical protein
MRISPEGFGTLSTRRISPEGFETLSTSRISPERLRLYPQGDKYFIGRMT